jgi:hypothetical protein
LAFPIASKRVTYDLAGLESTNYGLYNYGTDSYESDAGSQVTISKHDKTAKRIEGTFNFNGKTFPNGDKNVTVSEGSFAVTYQ